MTIVGFNKKTIELRVPAGRQAGAPGAGSSQFFEPVQVHMSFGVDGANAVPATSLRGHPFSVVRTSQGLYTVTLGGSTDLAGKYGVRKIVTAIPHLQKSAANNLRAEPGQITDASGTIEVRIVNGSTGAVADPAAAGAHERVHLVVTFDNGAV